MHQSPEVTLVLVTDGSGIVRTTTSAVAALQTVILGGPAMSAARAGVVVVRSGVWAAVVGCVVLGALVAGF